MEVWIFPLLSSCPRPAFGPVAQQQSGLHRLSKRQLKLPCVPRSLSASLPLSPFLILPPPFCPHTSSKSFPSFWMCFTASGLPQKQSFQSPRFKCIKVIGKHENPLRFYNEDGLFLVYYKQSLSLWINWHFLTWCMLCCRYEQPKCDGNARAHPTKPKDHYRSRHLQGRSLKTGLTSVFPLCSVHMVKFFSRPLTSAVLPRLW